MLDEPVLQGREEAQRKGNPEGDFGRNSVERDISPEFVRAVLQGLAADARETAAGRWRRWRWKSPDMREPLTAEDDRCFACHPASGESGRRTMAPGGVEFDIPAGERHLYSVELQTALRRLHLNAGHPSLPDLLRCLRMSKASNLAIKLAQHLRCST